MMPPPQHHKHTLRAAGIPNLPGQRRYLKLVQQRLGPWRRMMPPPPPLVRYKKEISVKQVRGRPQAATEPAWAKGATGLANRGAAAARQPVPQLGAASPPPPPRTQEGLERGLPGLPARLPPLGSKKWMDTVARVEAE